MTKYINKRRCRECKGACCKRSGCTYLPEDFSSMELESLLSIINEGNITIIASTFDFFKEVNSPIRYGSTYQEMFWSYYLYLKVRNVNGSVIAFFEDESPCCMLSDSGCLFSDDERPSLGLSLIPEKRRGEGCNQLAYKYMNEVRYDWIKYQTVLEQVVHQIAGKSSWDLLVEKSEVDSYLATLIKSKHKYVNPSDAIKVLLEKEKRIVDETTNVKQLILGSQK